MLQIHMSRENAYVGNVQTDVNIALYSTQSDLYQLRPKAAQKIQRLAGNGWTRIN
jgi:hypothetical protein